MKNLDLILAVMLCMGQSGLAGSGQTVHGCNELASVSKQILLLSAVAGCIAVPVGQCPCHGERNGNGRAIKSKLWSPNRVDKIDAPVNAIFWIMKDPTIPPVVKLKGAALASVMGATLATKTSTAERVAADTIFFSAASASSGSLS